MASHGTRAKYGGRPEKTYPLMSRRQIESLIAEGHKVVIVNQFVLKVDAWLPYHPGGKKSIEHMVGKDATDEVNGLHSAKTCQMMNKYRIGRIDGLWENFLPPIQGGTFRLLDSCNDTHAQDSDASTGSSSRSLSPPPIFDNDDDNDDDEEEADRNNHAATTRAPRRRHCSHRGRRSTSPCTLSSSVYEADANDEKENAAATATSFLDVRTREQINLDLEKYPALDMATQQHVVAKYRQLDERLRAAGLYDCDYTAYAWECSRYLMLGGLAYVFLRAKWYAISAFFLGCLWHQLVFCAHDAGHMGITHDFRIDTVIGIIIADFIGGLSLCWWKDNHNVHHIVTNLPEHDPDIEHMPFFAVSHRLLQNLRSTYYERVMKYDAAAKFFLSFQHWSYYPILCFGRFNLYFLSFQYIGLGLGPRKGSARWHRWLEAVGQIFFWTWFGYGVLYCSIDTNWDRFIYVMISHVVTMPLHVQITLSHFAMSTADLGPRESFPQRMLRTTMDVDCPLWLDFFHGGLQFQAIHHMYPRMPRHNLRKAQAMVQEFCDDVGIPYALYGFVDGNKEVIGRLADVSRQAAILSQCQKALAEGRV